CGSLRKTLLRAAARPPPPPPSPRGGGGVLECLRSQKKGGPWGPFDVSAVCRSLLGQALVDVLLRALVEAGVEHGLDGLALHEVLHHERSLVAHLEGPLADLDMAAAR